MRSTDEKFLSIQMDFPSAVNFNRGITLKPFFISIAILKSARILHENAEKKMNEERGRWRKKENTKRSQLGEQK